MNPKISVVMPVYNAEKYLDKAIQSILQQSYKEFEFIIINDGSTDNSLNIIKKYLNIDNRIILINRKNKGLIYSLNEGIKKAQGKYIARMDADDICLSRRFEKQLELMENKELDICGCHYFKISEDDNFIGTQIVPVSNESIILYLSVTIPFAHPSTMIKKSFLDKNNILYGMTSFKNAEDYALWHIFYEKGAKFGNVDEFLFKYREFNQSLSKTNKSNIFKDRKLLSNSFISKNKDFLFMQLDNKLNNIKNIDDMKVLIIMNLIKYHFSFKYFKYFKTLNKKALICGILKFFADKR